MSNTGSPQRDYRSGFSHQISKEFIIEITQSMRDADGNPRQANAIWIDMVEVLGLSGDQEKQYVLGLKRDRTRPISPFDAQEDDNPPPLETVLRYVAAIDHPVKFPPGREIVNRALATALRRMRYARTGELLLLTAPEVERFRFIRQWKKNDIPRPDISFRTVDDMRSRSSKYRSLMEPIRRDKKFVEELKVLPKRWTEVFSDLVKFTKYEWLNKNMG